MAVPFAKIALIGLGGATTASGAYLMLKPDSDAEDKTFSAFYDSMRDSIIPEDDREELRQMGIQIQEGIEETHKRFGNAALWLLEKENYKTIFKDISDVVNKKGDWKNSVKRLSSKLGELVQEVKKDKNEIKKEDFSEDRIVSKALSADLENMNSKLESLRIFCLQSESNEKEMDCNLEELYLPTKELLDSWKDESSTKGELVAPAE